MDATEAAPPIAPSIEPSATNLLPAATEEPSLAISPRKPSIDSLFLDEQPTSASYMVYSVSSANASQRRTVFPNGMASAPVQSSNLSNTNNMVLSHNAAFNPTDINTLNPKDIAQFLIDKGYLLTALELYTELNEDGMEIRELRDFFADHRHFETAPRPSGISTTTTHGRNSSDTYSVLETVSSMDEGHSLMSSGEQAEIVREKNEYIAVLEYELRQSKDTSEKLRGKLAQMVKAVAEDSELSHDQANKVAITQIPLSSAMDPMAAAINLPSAGSAIPASEERRVLNYLVNAYLKHHAFKMTALSFADENDDQNLEDWEEITGVPKDIAPPPPSITQLYRSWRFGFASGINAAPAPAAIAANEIAEAPKSINDNYHEQNSVDTKITQTAQTPKSALQVLEPKTLTKRRPTFDSDASSTRPSTIDMPRLMLMQPSIKPNLGRTLSGDLESDIVSVSHTATPITLQNSMIPEVDHDKPETTIAATSTAKPDAERFVAQKLLKIFNLQQPTQTNGFYDLLNSTDKDVQLSSVLSAALPKIIPNVLINKRDEMLPLLVTTILHTADAGVKANLLSQLFLLMKRPDVSQRQAICDGCMAALSSSNASQLMSVVVRNVEELSSAKTSERRLLAIELCGRIAPCAGTQSLDLFYVLASLLQDLHPEVRFNACRNLAILTNYLDLKETVAIEEYTDLGETLIRDLRCLPLPMHERSEKPKVFHLLSAVIVLSAQDTNSDVYRIAFEILLPVLFDRFRRQSCFDTQAVADSSADGGLLEFIYWILSNMTVMTQPKMEYSSDHNAAKTDESTHALASVLLKILDCSLQHLHLLVLLKSPFEKPNIEMKEQDLYENQDVINKLQRSLQLWIGAQFEYAYENEQDKDDAQKLSQIEAWPEFRWFLDTFVRMLLGITQNMQPYMKQAYIEMFILFRSIGQLFGSNLVKFFLKPKLESYLDLISERNENDLLRPNLTVIYICGLTTLAKHGSLKTVETLKELYLKAALGEKGWSGERDIIFIRLSINGLLYLSQKYLEPLIQAFSELSSNDDVRVRFHLPSIASVLAPLSSISLLLKKIIPWANQLANDNDRSIRALAVPLYGTIIEVGGREREVWEKLEIQISAFFDDPLPAVKLEALLLFASRSGLIDQQFRDTVVMPLILRWATMDLRGKTPTDDTDKSTRLQLCLSALHVFRSISSSSVPENIIQQFILPSITLLKRELQVLTPDDIGPVMGKARSIAALNAETNPKTPGNDRSAWLDVNMQMAESPVDVPSGLTVKTVKDVGLDSSLFNEALDSCKLILQELSSVFDIKDATIPSDKKSTFTSQPISLIKNLSSSLTKKMQTEVEVSAKLAAPTVSTTFNSAFTSRPGTAEENSSAAPSPFKKATTSFFSSKFFQKFQVERSANPSNAATPTTEKPPLIPKPIAAGSLEPVVLANLDAVLPEHEVKITEKPSSPVPLEQIDVVSEKCDKAGYIVIEQKMNSSAPANTETELKNVEPSSDNIPYLPAEDNDIVGNLSHIREESDIFIKLGTSRKSDGNISLLSLTAPINVTADKNATENSTEPTKNPEPRKNFFDFDDTTTTPASEKIHDDHSSIDFIIDTVYPVKEVKSTSSLEHQ